MEANQKPSTLDGIIDAWARMSDFSGISSRRQFYTYALSFVVIGPVLAVLVFWFSSFYEFYMPNYFLNMAPVELMFAVLAVCFVPLVALTARRMRDAGLSPWLTLVLALPLVGIVGASVLAARPPDSGVHSGKL